jgi:hypothetical protein
MCNCSLPFKRTISYQDVFGYTHRTDCFGDVRPLPVVRAIQHRQLLVRGAEDVVFRELEAVGGWVAAHRGDCALGYLGFPFSTTLILAGAVGVHS